MRRALLPALLLLTACGGDHNRPGKDPDPTDDSVVTGDDSAPDDSAADDSAADDSAADDSAADDSGDPDADDDGDGYAASVDCDDGDKSVHPGADEVVADGLDQDCDGGDSCYNDTDRDGYGSEDTVLSADLDCEDDAEAALAHDCDDTNPDVSPAATEYCNGVDDNCDGKTDPSVSADAATWVRDADGDGYGSASGATITACNQPKGYADNADDCDDTDATAYPGATEDCTDGVDNNCDGTVDESCPVEHCGVISKSETWSAAEDHLVTCDVYVIGSSSPVLTIEDGATVSFDVGTGLYVGDGGKGELDVQGTTTGVTFTSSEASPAPGDWLGVTFGSQDTGSTLDGLTVEYGGDNGLGALLAKGSVLTVTNSLIRTSSTDGIYLSAGDLVLTDSALQDNDGNGLYLSSTTELMAFSANTFTGNGKYPVDIHADAAEGLDTASTFASNGTDAIRLRNGTVTADATWVDPGVYYQVVGDIYVQASATSPTLTLEDGVELRFDTGKALYVGYSAAGALETQGSTKGVLLTSSASSPAAGDWDGVWIGSYATDADVILTGLTIEYGGDNTYGNLYLEGTNATISDCTFADSSKDGLRGNTSTPSISGSTFSDNGSYGIYLDSASGLSSLSSSTFSGNSSGTLVVPGDYADTVDNTNTFDAAVTVSADFITANATWVDIGVPWYLSGDIYVDGSATPKLTIDPGNELTFNTGAGIIVGYTSYGAFKAVGTSTKPITFSSAKSSPAAGDWDGLTFQSNCSDANVTMEYVTVSYGGNNGYGNVYFYACNGSIKNSTVAYSSKYGIYRGGSASPTVSGITYTSNTSGTIY